MPNVFSVATEGKEFRYGSIRMPVDLWGPWRSRQTTTRRRCSAGRDRRSTRCCGPHVVLDLLANFTAFATDKKQAAHQDHLPLPAVRGRQPDRRARGRGPPEEGPDLALPGLGQVAADGVRRAEAAAASGAREPDGDDRGRPHRPRQPDHRHLQRRRHAEPGEGRQPRGAAATCSRRTCARSSSRPSTSSARPTAC